MTYDRLHNVRVGARTRVSDEGEHLPTPGKRTLVETLRYTESDRGRRSESDASGRLLDGPHVPHLEANIMTVGTQWRTDPASFYALRARLAELSLIPAPEPLSAPDAYPPITASDLAAVTTALSTFQAAHHDEIQLILADSRLMQTITEQAATAADHRWAEADRRWRAVPHHTPDDTEPERPTHRTLDANQGTQLSDGGLAQDDATHQALVNAWPRRFLGTLLQNAEAAFEYLQTAVQSRSLPFDPERVNVVSIRGMRGGVQHHRDGAGFGSAPFDDTFFVVARGRDGAGQVREFPGTTEPGGHGAGRDTSVQEMDPDQQVVFHVNTNDHSKLDRPTITPRVVTETGQGLVNAPNLRAQPNVNVEPPTGLTGDPNALPSGVTPGGLHMRDRLRTQMVGRNAPQDRSHGIAIHSGEGNPHSATVHGDSTGCQVIQGDWYGNFYQTVQRALADQAARQHLTRTTGEGDILYSLLQASDVVASHADRPASQDGAAKAFVGPRATKVDALAPVVAAVMKAPGQRSKDLHDHAHEPANENQPANDHEAAHPAAEWDGHGQPAPGQTIQGHLIESDRGGLHHFVIARGIRFTVKPHGLMYLGEMGPYRAAATRAAALYATAGRPYFAAAARGTLAIAEGGVGAINTWDSVGFTLGPGLTHNRIRSMVRRLPTEAAATLGTALSRLLGPVTEAQRFDVETLSLLVVLIEQTAITDAIADAEIAEVVEGSSLGRNPAGEQVGDQIASQVAPELIGVATHLSHGFPTYAPDPPGDVAVAARLFPGNPSAQLAVIYKLYVQRYVHLSNTPERAHTIMTQHLPQQTQELLRLHAFPFDLGAARVVVPCFATSSSWPSTTTPPPEGNVVVTDRAVYWDFGPRLSG